MTSLVVRATSAGEIASNNYFELYRNETNHLFVDTAIKIAKFLSYLTLIIPLGMLILGVAAKEYSFSRFYSRQGITALNPGKLIPVEEALRAIGSNLDLREVVTINLIRDEVTNGAKVEDQEPLESMARALIDILNRILETSQAQKAPNASIQDKRNINFNWNENSLELADPMRNFRSRYSEVGLPEELNPMTLYSREGEAGFKEGKVFKIFSALHQAGYIFSFPEDLRPLYLGPILNVQL